MTHPFGKKIPLIPSAFLFIFLFLLSCSKDSDLMTEHILKGGQVVDDSFKVASSNSSILDVLSNDSFTFPGNVRIVEISAAQNGNVVINEDYTITYTPKKEIPEGIDSQETITTEEATTEENTDTVETTTEETITEETVTEEETTEEPTVEESTPEETTIEDNTSETPEETTTPEETASEETTPEEETETIEDSFTYTAETENEDGTVTTETGTVTVEVEAEPESEPEPEKITYNVEDGYFVTVNGKSGNDGRSEQTAWSLEHAVNVARAGDVVNIKAGTYNKSELRFGNNGTSSDPIVFIGYRDTPGDISTTPHGTMDHGDNIHSIGFPVINPSSKITLWIEGDHIELHNIGFTDPEGTSSYGALVDGEHNLLDNLAFSDYGPNGGTYKGWGVYVRGNHNQVINSYGENCGAEGFSVGPSMDGKGNDNVIKNNDYYSDDINKQSDYFFTVTYRGSNSNTASRNLFEGNRGYRLHDGSHLGHGLANAGGNNNTWRNNLMHRSRIEVRYETSYNIVYEGNRLTGFEDTEITISNGSHHLTFRNNYIEADYALIIFNALSGYNSDGLYSTSTGHDIDIYNNIFVGGRRSFTFGEEGIRSGSSHNITISNNVFDRQSGGTRFYTPVSSLKVDNNIFTNSTSSKWVSHNGKSPGLSARNNIFHGNEHATPTSGFSGTINADPRFTNSGSGAERYKLQSGSPAINAGVSYSERIAGFAGKVISGSTDIGAFEY